MAQKSSIECPQELFHRLRGVRVLYADLDNTFTWKGSLFKSPNGPTLAAARAILRLNEIDVELVLSSGRNRMQMQQDARMMGCSHYIAELGAMMGFGRDVEYTFSWEHLQDPKQRMLSLGTMEKLNEFSGGSIEEYYNWNENRECSLLLRGVINTSDANEMMEKQGLEFELQDNGVSAASDADGRNLHVYHLMPRGVNKTWGVKKHMEAQGIERDDAVFVGDAITDLACSDVVGVMGIVSNGIDADHNLAVEFERTPNAIATTLPCAEGVEQLVNLIVEAKGA